VVSKGNYVDVLITVDPVGITKPNFSRVAEHSGHWVNIDSTDTEITVGNTAAIVGQAYNDLPLGFADVHISRNMEHVEICSYYCSPSNWEDL
jgi:hypothetical protein